MARFAAAILFIGAVASFAVGLMRWMIKTDGLPLPERCDPDGSRCWAVFAMGCFWCAEADFEKFPVSGAIGNVRSGYMGGQNESPNYQNYAGGGHYEVAAVPYDPRVVSYEVLLLWFWRNIDFLDGSGQFCDRGGAYRAAVFALGEEQRAAAEQSRRLLGAALGMQVATQVLSAGQFWVAEDYHQAYYKEEADCYDDYRSDCGRNLRLQQLWEQPVWRDLTDWAAAKVNGSAMQGTVATVMAVPPPNAESGSCGLKLTHHEGTILLLCFAVFSFCLSIICLCWSCHVCLCQSDGRKEDKCTVQAMRIP